MTRALESPESGAAQTEDVEAPPAQPQTVQPSRSSWLTKGISSARDWALWVLDKFEAYGYMLSHVLIIATLNFGIFGIGVASSSCGTNSRHIHIPLRTAYGPQSPTIA